MNIFKRRRLDCFSGVCEPLNHVELQIATRGNVARVSSVSCISVSIAEELAESWMDVCPEVVCIYIREGSTRRRYVPKAKTVAGVDYVS